MRTFVTMIVLFFSFSAFAGQKTITWQSVSGGINTAINLNSPCAYANRRSTLANKVCEGIRMSGDTEPCGYANRPQDFANVVCYGVRDSGFRGLR